MLPYLARSGVASVAYGGFRLSYVLIVSKSKEYRPTNFIPIFRPLALNK